MDLDAVHSRLRQRHRDLQARLLPMVFPPARGERQRARLLDDTYDEWSLLYAGQSDASHASTELIELAVRAITRAGRVDLGAVAARATRDQERHEVVTWPGEHYRMLVALAEEWRRGDRVRVIEVGTFTGASALSLLTSSAVEAVSTFDVVPWDSVPFTMLRDGDFVDRLEQRIGDLAEPEVFAANADLLSNADVVFVDAAKDGVFEYRFLPRLLQLQPSRPQLVILDDVKVLPMVNLWRSLPLPKLDIASFGHWSGTGIVTRSSALLSWTPPPAVLQRAFRPLLRRRRRRDG